MMRKATEPWRFVRRLVYCAAFVCVVLALQLCFAGRHQGGTQNSGPVQYSDMMAIESWRDWFSTRLQITIRLDDESELVDIANEPPSLDYWARIRIVPHYRPANRIVTELAIGWPFRFSRCTWMYFPQTPMPWQIAGGHELPGLARVTCSLGITMESPRGVPLSPIWTGLLLNTIAYVIIFELLVLAYRSGRRIVLNRRRTKRGQCLKCGYSKQGLPQDCACPECGHDYVQERIAHHREAQAKQPTRRAIRIVVCMMLAAALLILLPRVRMVGIDGAHGGGLLGFVRFTLDPAGELFCGPRWPGPCDVALHRQFAREHKSPGLLSPWTERWKIESELTPCRTCSASAGSDQNACDPAQRLADAERVLPRLLAKANRSDFRRDHPVQKLSVPDRVWKHPVTAVIDVPFVPGIGRNAIRCLMVLGVVVALAAVGRDVAWFARRRLRRSSSRC